MTGRLLKKVRMPPNMMFAMVGMSPERVQRLTLKALEEAGIDTSDPKAITFERMADGGCAFAGPPKTPGS